MVHNRRMGRKAHELLVCTLLEVRRVQTFWIFLFVSTTVQHLLVYLLITNPKYLSNKLIIFNIAAYSFNFHKLLKYLRRHEKTNQSQLSKWLPTFVFDVYSAIFTLRVAK